MAASTFPLSAPRGLLAAAILAAVTSLAACGNDGPSDERNGHETDAATTTEDAEILARIDGEPITRADVFTYSGLDDDPGLAGDDGVIDELISLRLLRQEAERRGLHEEEETRRILEMVRTNFLASEMMERLTAELELTEDDLRAEYERQVEQMAAEEYRARHILVESEETARELLTELEDGVSFSELAEAHSTDRGSAQRGGDLGWFEAGRMVPAFSDAVQRLEPGETTTDPVESRFGWHLIRLEETRPVDPPPMEDVRAELIEILESRAIQEEIERLREAARIEIPERPAN